jgi:hypothetical protein
MTVDGVLATGARVASNLRARSGELMDKKSKFSRIATEINSAEQVLKAIGARKRQDAAPESAERRVGYVAPRTELESFLARKWQEMLGVDRIGVHDNFFELGVNSIKAAIFLNSLQQDLGEAVYVVTLFDSPTIAGLAAYLTAHYPQAVSRVCGPASIESGAGEEAAGDSRQAPLIDASKVAQFRQSVSPSPAAKRTAGAAEARNPPAIFILAPPRSGTTLLRVMLAGHPSLFAPPELQLLYFDTLAERREAFSGRNAFWQEGAIRALMQIKGCDAGRARMMMEGYERDGLTTQAFYRLMQGWLADRTLVDKTPFYALDLNTLKRAEDYFRNALYIHLLRHPQGAIRSFEEARIDQVFWYTHRFPARELAELVWLVSHQNILEFFKTVPAARQFQIKFEDLVSRPGSVAEETCQFLGLKFHPEMLRPHDDNKSRMTDGLDGVPRMLGDLKFHSHNKIDSSAADRWAKGQAAPMLADMTREMAAHFGYETMTKPANEAPAIDDPPIDKAYSPIRPVPRKNKNLNQFLEELEQLSDDDARLLLENERL